MQHCEALYVARLETSAATDRAHNIFGYLYMWCPGSAKQ